MVFGHLADTMGRRRVTLVSIAGFSVCTLLIGLLPGHATWGLLAPATLVGLRFVDGIFLGGEYTAATPLAFEHCPPRARGLFGGLLMGAYAAAYAVVSALVLALLVLLPPGAYEQWGWRIPFVVGGLAGFVFLAWRARVPESPLWQADAGSTSATPARRLLRGPARRDFAQVLVMMSGLWLAGSSVVSVLPQRLLAHLDQSPAWVTAVLLVAQPFVICGFVATGMLGQRIGRRPVLVGAAGLAAVGAVTSYAVMMTAPVSVWSLALLVVATEVMTLAVWGAVTSYVNERFVTAVRATGFGVAYSLALVPASFYAFYLTGLAHVMPEPLTQLVLLSVGGVLGAVGAWWGPETRDVDLLTVGTHEPGKVPVEAAPSRAGAGVRGREALRRRVRPAAAPRGQRTPRARPWRRRSRRTPAGTPRAGPPAT
jgi:MFS family permease